MPKSKMSVVSIDESNNTTYDYPRSLSDLGLSQPRMERHTTSLSADDIRLHSPTESTGLLIDSDGERYRRYTRSELATPTQRQLTHSQSITGSLRSRRTTSARHLSSLPVSPTYTRASGLRTPRLHATFGNAENTDGLTWYDQFTSTDWVHDSIADGYRVLELRRLKGWRGKARVFFDSTQGWLLVAIVGGLTASTAYVIDVSEASIFDIKKGYCSDKWYLSHNECCLGPTSCARWRPWSQVIRPNGLDSVWVDYIAFTVWCMVFAAISCFVTLFSKTVVPSSIASTFDENLGAAVHRTDNTDTPNPSQPAPTSGPPPANVYYSAAGSGVAEVKVILSGFVLHGYLGLKTFILKALALVFSVSSGMSIGKEGPYVHIATCIGNVACRLFSKYSLNDGKRREVLSASASSGVAVAFGSPLGGVLFGLEEVSYYFPPKTLFRTFFCCVVAALGLKFLNPYGTNKIVLFEVRYITDWRIFELFWFAMLGFAGGLLGALFIKASKFWATTFRKIPVIKKHPMVEVLLVALLTGLLGFWNRYTKIGVAELLAELASPCTAGSITGLCPAAEDIPSVIYYLLMAFVIKAFLTVIAFGIKVPAGIYVPSMVVGGLLGRIVGHTVQWLIYRFPHSWAFGYCSNSNSGAIEECVTPGVYALIAAGATMCGVTRLTVTLVVILFELSGSLDHVVAFSLAILCAKWTADAVEPLSIYDLLTDMNSYPFLDNKSAPVFDSELGDITPHMRWDKIIDITISPLVKASELRARVNKLHTLGELDGGLPIVRNKKLVGLIPAPDLEFALDKIEVPEDEVLCLMLSSNHPYSSHNHGWPGFYDEDDTISEATVPDPNNYGLPNDPIDLTAYVDPAPVALDIHSPMDLVYQSFVKLGLRYMCVLSEGEFCGMVHKKTFVKYVKTLEDHK